MKYIILILTFLSINTTLVMNNSAHSETNNKNRFVENKKLWRSIDNINTKLTAYNKSAPQMQLRILFLSLIFILVIYHL